MSARNQTVNHIAEVTPSDTADLATTSVGIHVNESGDVQMTLASGSTVTLALLAGVSYPYEVKRVWDSDTTATGIHALYY